MEKNMDNMYAEQTIENLKAKGQKTDIEVDIVETWEDLNRCPFDYEKAKLRVLSNDAKYPDIKALIVVKPQTVVKPINYVTEDDLKYNLSSQVELLLVRAGFQIE